MPPNGIRYPMSESTKAVFLSYASEDTAAAERICEVETEELRLMSTSIQIAEVHAWRGENDKAFEWLERAYAQRDSAISRLKVSPIIQFSPLPRDPPYAALLRRLLPV
jgi:hypothetical protein